MQFTSRLVSTALSTGFFALSSSCAFSQVLEAEYQLLNDLEETSQAYGHFSLGGTPSPAPPNNGVCINGLHPLVHLGQSASTPPITGLDVNDFEVTVELKVDALDWLGAPVVMGGEGWLGMYVVSNGQMAIRYGNNGLELSNATIAIGVWHSSTIKFEAGLCELWLDGNLVLAVHIGALVNPQNNLRFKTDHFGSLSNLNGCIRELAIYNDTTIVSSPPVGTSYCPQQPVQSNDSVVTIHGSINVGVGSGLHLEMEGGPPVSLDTFSSAMGRK